jgi:SPP1 family predicted phage head-tail adaptor
MDRSQVITLISQNKIQDENGVWRTIENARSVFCSVNSVTRNEFFEGGRNGLNPEYQITMFRYDYNGETIIKYEGQRYGIYRTYFGRDDTIELYVERKGGTNGNAKGWG